MELQEYSKILKELDKEILEETLIYLRGYYRVTDENFDDVFKGAVDLLTRIIKA